MANTKTTCGRKRIWGPGAFDLLLCARVIIFYSVQPKAKEHVTGSTVQNAFFQP